ncbi:MAG: ZIP family metal transporter [Candidatus Omnitrophica bacterium]|nr:ZIP family metal transporter [Candidatus Omnitrophota bacterium]MCM8800137.1 ZIP family metal transporter [Candidatus Omnitrophota bacterium]
MNFILALGASIIVSIISFVGVFSLFLKENILKKILLFLIAFAAGGLIGGSFLHLLPEAIEKNTNILFPFLNVILGFILFFIIEKYFRWRHCHKGKNCDIHIFSYLNLIGDGIHNFMDGIIVGLGFFTNIKIGIATTLAVILHEIPQELGDFGVLLYGGFSRIKAVVFNFISALTAILGTILGYIFSENISGFSILLLPLIAGGFIYIASCDLIPELHRQIDIRSSTFSMLFFILGILLMLGLKVIYQ